MKKQLWHVYIIQCKDNSYYTGITNDLEKRMQKHKSGNGSKYVRAKGFSKLLASKKFSNKIEALKAEYKIKQMPKEKKLKEILNF